MNLFSKLANFRLLDTNFKCSVLSALFSIPLFIIALVIKSSILLLLTPVLAKLFNILIGRQWMLYNRDFDIDDHANLNRKARYLNLFFIFFIVTTIGVATNLVEYIFSNALAFPIWSVVFLLSIMILSRTFIILTDTPFGLFAFLYEYDFDYYLTENQKQERKRLSILGLAQAERRRSSP